jgi:hypothetical protein
MRDDCSFVYVPPGIDTLYLESVISRAVGRKISIVDYATTNLCAGN